MCIVDVHKLRGKVLEEDHGSQYSINPGATKTFCDHREVYWWDGLKRDTTKFVVKCPHFKQVKDEHLKSSGLTQTMEVLL